MSNLIRREDALRVTLAYSSSYSAEQAETAIRALPAVQPDAREVALREAVNGLRKAAEDLDGYVGRGYGDEYLELADSLALPAVQPGHVNETPKSEHDARNMLTLTAERDRYRKALEDIIADCGAAYPPSHGAIKYAAKLALKGEGNE